MIPIPKTTHKTHTTPIQIRFNDIDIAAHVNNAVYQNYFDLAKTRFFDDIFGDLIDWETKGLVVAHIAIDYFNPTYFKDDIVVESSINTIGSKSFEMTQVVRTKGSVDKNDIKCVSKSIMVAYHYKEAYSFVLPDSWVEALKSKL